MSYVIAFILSGMLAFVGLPRMMPDDPVGPCAGCESVSTTDPDPVPSALRLSERHPTPTGEGLWNRDGKCKCDGNNCVRDSGYQSCRSYVLFTVNPKTGYHVLLNNPPAYWCETDANEPLTRLRGDECDTGTDCGISDTWDIILMPGSSTCTSGGIVGHGTEVTLKTECTACAGTCTAPPN